MNARAFREARGRLRGRGRRGRRSGDVFFIQDFYALLLFVLLALLLFVLFALLGKHFQEKIGGQAVEGLAVSVGGSTLRAYLGTRLDEPLAKFLPPGADASLLATIKGHGITFQEAIVLIAEDEECLKALRKHGAGWTPPFLDDSDSFLQRLLAPVEQVPSGLCRDFLARTLLFFSALEPRSQYQLVITTPTDKVFLRPVNPKISPTGAPAPAITDFSFIYNLGDVAGEQPLPGNIVVELLLGGAMSGGGG